MNKIVLAPKIMTFSGELYVQHNTMFDKKNHFTAQLLIHVDIGTALVVQFVEEFPFCTFSCLLENALYKTKILDNYRIIDKNSDTNLYSLDCRLNLN